MIQIHADNKRIVVQGHAGFAPLGQDIVCAAVSALVQTWAQALEQLARGEADFRIEPGKAVVCFKACSEKGRLLTQAFLLGAERIAQAYPENVRVVCTGRTWMA